MSRPLFWVQFLDLRVVAKPFFSWEGEGVNSSKLGPVMVGKIVFDCTGLFGEIEDRIT